jgi:GT2 family glycosyltransferase
MNHSGKVLPEEVDVVMLSYARDRQLFDMNVTAIRTLRESNPSVRFNVFLIESNKEFNSLGWTYDPETVVHIPQAKFNYNAFNNIGMRMGKAPWILFTNNDVVFHPGSIEKMIAAHQEHPQIQCLCPVDPVSSYTPPGFFPKGQKIAEGYHVRTTFTGWCFLVRRSIFDDIKAFDENFDYYFADDDFVMELRKFDIRNAAVVDAHVNHLYNATSSKSDGDFNERMQKDYVRFHQKWGSPRLIAWRNRLAVHLLRPMGMKGLINRLYAAKVAPVK